VRINVSKSDETTVVVLKGEIVSRDDQTAVTKIVAEQLDDGERTFVIDLSEVPYISSIGIAVLVATSVKVNREGGELRLVNPRPKVAQVLEMTKVSGMFSTYTSMEKALSAV